MIELNLAYIIQLINFGILVLVLNLFLYKPLRKILSERQQTIASARDKASSVDIEVQNKMNQYESRLREAKNEAAARRADALKVALTEEAAILESARKKANASLESIRLKVANEAAGARQLLNKQAEILSGDICEKILGRSL